MWAKDNVFWILPKFFLLSFFFVFSLSSVARNVCLCDAMLLLLLFLEHFRWCCCWLCVWASGVNLNTEQLSTNTWVGGMCVIEALCWNSDYYYCCWKVTLRKDTLKTKAVKLFTALWLLLLLLLLCSFIETRGMCHFGALRCRNLDYCPK